MKLVFATHNLNKFKEVQSLLPDTIELVSLTDIGCNDDIPETETTIEGNALLKVKHIKDNYVVGVVEISNPNSCVWIYVKTFFFDKIFSLF